MKQHVVPARYYKGMSQIVLRFFAIAVFAILVAGSVAAILMTLFPRAETGPSLHFPSAFMASTGLLLAGSISIERALGYVRLERQTLFLRWMLIALIVGASFMGVQTFALWSMFPEHRSPEDASLESTAFALALAALHALHFFVAVLFVSWVTARSWSHRYDHEYHWGVKFCARFWHALGIVWLAILLVFFIAST